jgi:hypothetical protein
MLPAIEARRTPDERRSHMTARALSFDERKAAEAAFQGEAPDPEWTIAGQLVYVGIIEALANRHARSRHYEDACSAV